MYRQKERKFPCVDGVEYEEERVPKSGKVDRVQMKLLHVEYTRTQTRRVEQ